MNVPVTRGLETVIDDEDYEWVSRFSWFAICPSGKGKWYAATNRPLRHRTAGPGILYLHRLVLRLDGLAEGDHISGDTLDNRRINLRPCTRQQNVCNRPAHRGHLYSRYKGVTYSKRDRVWKAQAGLDGRNYHLGSFSRAEDAARAYDVFAREHYGDFAQVNFQ